MSLSFHAPESPELKPRIVVFGVGGAELALGESASLFGEVLYRFLEIDGADVDGFDIGSGEEAGELTGLSFNAGLLFKF